MPNRKITILILGVLLAPGFNAFAQGDVSLYFQEPATHFSSSLPLGNGRLGAMAFGHPVKDRIVLNEISMWSGGVQDPNRKDAHQYLKPIQDLLLAGDNIAAQDLLQKHFVSAGKGSGHGNGAKEKYGCYQILGDLFINWKDTSADWTDYKRILRTDSAIVRTEWTRKGVKYIQEVIVSAPHQAILVRLKASKPGQLHFNASLYRKEAAEIAVAGQLLQMRGVLDGGEREKGITYATVMNAMTDGHKKISKEGIDISNASTCLLIITAGTNMNWPQVEQPGPDPVNSVREENKKLAATTWPRMLSAHVQDYQRYFNRCRLYLGSNNPSGSSTLPTPDRLQSLAKGNADPSLVSLYFNFGRYLLISSSRPGGMPANLQGLWAEEYQTPWNGDYHININLQMNYWLSDITNLSACQQPVFTLLQQMEKYGRATAKAYYNSKGWVAHVITNPWGFTAPGEGAEWGSTLTGGAWMATHILQAFQYNPDKKFAQQYYPILKGASRFFLDILVKEPKHGWLVTAPSNSPENTYILPDGRKGNTCMGPTMDMQIGRELLKGTASFARLLNIDKQWADTLLLTAGQLVPNQVSPETGALQEWLEDYAEAEPQHRHVSHLYGLHPYDEMTPWSTPSLVAAVKKTLQRRGDGGTGWSRAWKMAFWARLGDGDQAYKMLQALLTPVGASDKIHMSRGAGTYPNLFDAHPPFQIDGNFGATAAIAEMLVQSHGEKQVIRLLPALPADPAFAEGKIAGIKARNGFEINMAWQKGSITSLQIKSTHGNTCRVQGPITINKIVSSSGKPVTFSREGEMVVFATRKGERYTFYQR